MIARNRNSPFDVTVLWDDGVSDDYRHLRVIGEISRYYPAQGPTYSCGGQPAEGGDIEDYKIFDKVTGAEIPDPDGKIIDAIQDEVYDKVSEEAASDQADAAERRREAMEDR